MTEKKKNKTFPYSMFPVRLEHMEGKNKKICFFTHIYNKLKIIKIDKIEKVYELEINEIHDILSRKNTIIVINIFII